MKVLPSPLLVVTDRLPNPPPTDLGLARDLRLDAQVGQARLGMGEGAPRMRGGRGDRDAFEEFSAPLLRDFFPTRPSLTRRPPSPAEGGGHSRAIDAQHEFILTIDAIIDAGARWVWFRERDMDVASRRSLAVAVMTRVHAKGGTFSLGGDPDLAAEIGADGVHLPGGTTGDAIRRARNLLPNGLVGVSAHTLGEVETAAKAGADYVTLSPIFATASKPGYGPALGAEVLRAASAFGMPVIALGGITADKTGTCRDAGAAGIAVMGGLMRSPEPARAAAAFLAAWVQRPEGP